MTLIRCSGHEFKFGGNNPIGKIWYCIHCEFKVKTAKAVDYFTGKKS